MNEKYAILIDYLVKQNEFKTSNEIANTLGVSKRTIKNYIVNINNLSSEPVILSSHLGYKYNVDFDLTTLDLRTSNIPNTLESRSNYIAQKLISHRASEDLNLYALCESLFISLSTLKNVISYLNEKYKEFNVRIETKNNILILVGDERNKRRLIRSEIYSSVEGNILSTNSLTVNFPNLNVESLSTHIDSLVFDNKLQINDFSKSNLLLHILIIIQRNIHYKELSVDNPPQVTVSDNIKKIAEELIYFIEDDYSIKLNPTEKDEVTVLLYINSNLNSQITNEFEQFIDIDILELTRSIVSIIEQNYVVNLSDYSFFKPFSLHLNNLILRLQTNRILQNPMGIQIKNGAPLIFDIATTVALHITSIYGYEISEDEISFIALHIGAELERKKINHHKLSGIIYCPTYHNMSEQISDYITNEFGNIINIIDIITNESFNTILDMRFDILFTTFGFAPQQKKDRNIVEILPFDIEKNYKQIASMISDIQSTKRKQENKDHFNKFFDEKIFYINPGFTNKFEFIDSRSNEMYFLNYVDDCYKDGVIKREKAASTAFSNVAIPHSVDMNSIKTCVSVSIFKDGIIWDNNKLVYVVLLIAINENDRSKFRHLYENIVEIFNTDSNITEVKKIDCFESFTSYIKNKL